MTPPPAAPVRLVTVRFSHFSEKARWALDRAGIAYREESHVPILSWWSTLRAGGKRTVPCLVTPERVVDDSTDILRWADAQGSAPPLFAEGPAGEDIAALEREFSRRLGPATRRVAYFYLLQRPRVMRRFLASAGKGLEARLGALLFPVLRAIVVRGLRIDPVSVARSRAALDEAFANVERRLADGRRYLAGERGSARRGPRTRGARPRGAGSPGARPPAPAPGRRARRR